MTRAVVLWAVMVALIACKDRAAPKDPPKEEPATEAEPAAPEPPPVDPSTTAVVIAGRASVKAEPKKKGKWVATVNIGEKLSVLSADAPDGWLKVRLCDDQTEGFLEEKRISYDAKLAVATQPLVQYKKWEMPCSRTDELLQAGTLVLVESEDVGFAQVRIPGRGKARVVAGLLSHDERFIQAGRGVYRVDSAFASSDKEAALGMLELLDQFYRAETRSFMSDTRYESFTAIVDELTSEVDSTSLWNLIEPEEEEEEKDAEVRGAGTGDSAAAYQGILSGEWTGLMENDRGRLIVLAGCMGGPDVLTVSDMEPFTLSWGIHDTTSFSVESAFATPQEIELVGTYEHDEEEVTSITFSCHEDSRYAKRVGYWELGGGRHEFAHPSHLDSFPHKEEEDCDY